MKTAREVLMEDYKNAQEFEAALTNKVRTEFSNVAYETGTLYTAGYVVFHVQANYTPDQKDIVIDFDTLFRISGATYKTKQKWLRDNLGDNLGKLNDLFFVYPQQAVLDFLNSRGKNSGKTEIPV